MRFVERANAFFWNRVTRSVAVPPESLGIFRWVYGIFVLVLDTPHFAWLDHVPRAFFNPPLLSPASLLSGFPPSPFFTVLDSAGILSLCCMTIGFKTRAATLALLAIRLVGYNFHYSFGKIDHDIMGTLLLACMAVADWGSYYSIDARRRRAEPDRRSSSLAATRGLALLAVALAFGMVTAGLPKLVVWADFDLGTSGSLSWFYPNYHTLGRKLLLAGLVPGTPLLLFEVADCIGPILELLSFVALVSSRKLWLTWLCAAAGFHLANTLFLNIPFTTQAISYLAFANTARLVVRPGAPAASQVYSRKAVLLSALPFGLGIWHMAYRLTGSGSAIVFVHDYLSEIVVGVYGAVPICTVVTAMLMAQAFGRRATPLPNVLGH